MLQLRVVMPVNGPDVLQPQVLEHSLRGDDVLDALLHAVQSAVQRVTHQRGAMQDALAPRHEALIATCRAQG